MLNVLGLPVVLSILKVVREQVLYNKPQKFKLDACHKSDSIKLHLPESSIETVNIVVVFKTLNRDQEKLK